MPGSTPHTAPAAGAAEGLRPTRWQARTQAQTSPVPIGWAAIQWVSGSRVADVGCGSGSTGYLLRVAWEATESWRRQHIPRPRWLLGLDASPVALATCRHHRVYDETVRCDVARLPLADGSVDTALCAETVEHLFPAAAARLLAELARVARQRVIVTTPVPRRIIEPGELRRELAEAARDPRPLPYAEYLVLAAAVHKAWLRPAAMRRAGFRRAGRVMAGSAVYVADAGALRPAALGPVPGIGWRGYPADDQRGDWRDEYTELLAAALRMGREAHRLRAGLAGRLPGGPARLALPGRAGRSLRRSP